MNVSFEEPGEALIQMAILNRGPSVMKVAGIYADGAGVLSVAPVSEFQTAELGVETAVGVTAVVDFSSVGLVDLTLQFTPENEDCQEIAAVTAQVDLSSGIASACEPFGTTSELGDCPGTAVTVDSATGQVVSLAQVAESRGVSLEVLYESGAPTPIGDFWFWEEGWRPGVLPSPTLAFDGPDPQVGDLIFFFNADKPEDVRGWAIDALMGYTNHVAVYVGDGLIVHARDQATGVEEVELEAFLEDPSTNYELVMVARPQVSQDQLAEAAFAARLQVGKPYPSNLDLVAQNFKEPRNSLDCVDGYDAYYCSSLAWWAYACKANIDLDADGGGIVRPDDMILSPYLSWYVLSGSFDDLADEDGYGRSEWDADEDYDGDGYSFDEGDCNDTNEVIQPGYTDIADGWDNDCDGYYEEDESVLYKRWFCNTDASNTDWEHAFFEEGWTPGGCWEADGHYIRAIPEHVFPGMSEVMLSDSGVAYVLFDECQAAASSWTIYVAEDSVEWLALDRSEWDCQPWAFLGTSDIWLSHGGERVYRHDSDEYSTTMYSTNSMEGNEFEFSHSLAGYGLADSN